MDGSTRIICCQRRREVGVIKQHGENSRGGQRVANQEGSQTELNINETPSMENPHMETAPGRLKRSNAIMLPKLNNMQNNTSLIHNPLAIVAATEGVHEEMLRNKRQKAVGLALLLNQ
jgi:hypothetical protein